MHWRGSLVITVVGLIAPLQSRQYEQLMRAAMTGSANLLWSRQTW